MSKLPYGGSTYSKTGVADPVFSRRASHADGWRIFIEGRDYLDMVMGLGSVILGHRNFDVDEAIRRQLTLGTTLSTATNLESAAADLVLKHFPYDCSLQWGMNGSDATEGACRLARAYTGRDHILMSKDGYHGFHDWCLADTSRGCGIPEDQHVHWMEDDVRPDEIKSIAAVIIEPDLYPDRLKRMREMASDLGSLLIFDEVNTWQRYPQNLASKYIEIEPDLWCIGKSLGNGMPASAIVGRADILRQFAPPAPGFGENSNGSARTNAFFSSTWAGHPLSMAAIVATLGVMERSNGAHALWDKALDVYAMLANLSMNSPVKFSMSGPPFNRVTWSSQTAAASWRRLMFEHGVLIYSAHNVSLAFDDNALERLHRAWDASLRDLPRIMETAPEVEASGVMRR